MQTGIYAASFYDSGGYAALYAIDGSNPKGTRVKVKFLTQFIGTTQKSKQIFKFKFTFGRAEKVSQTDYLNKK